MPKTVAQMLADHEKFAATQPHYVVVCSECGQDWEPLVKSPLWWRAKKKADKGFLDAVHVSGKDCGCVKQPHRPEAPFRVIGYDMMCVDYDMPFDTFVDAVKAYRECYNEGDIVCIVGVSAAVEQKIMYP